MIETSFFKQILRHSKKIKCTIIIYKVIFSLQVIFKVSSFKIL